MSHKRVKCLLYIPQPEGIQTRRDSVYDHIAQRKALHLHILEADSPMLGTFLKVCIPKEKEQ